MLIQGLGNSCKETICLLKTPQWLNFPIGQRGVENLLNEIPNRDKETYPTYNSFKSKLFEIINNTIDNNDVLYYKFEKLQKEIWINFHSFILDNVTKVANYDSRVTPTQKDLIFYWNLIESISRYDITDYWIKQIYGVEDIEYNELDISNLIAVGPNKMKYIKIKQAYTKLFLSYINMYSSLKIYLTNYKWLSDWLSWIIPRKKPNDGINILHQICNFTFYWEIDQLYLREDFVRLLFKLDQLNEENVDEYTKMVLWYKFLSNIIKHRVLKDQLFSTNYTYKNIPSFPAIEETKYYKICKTIFKDNKKEFQNEFDKLKERTFYKEYLKGIASLPYIKDNPIKNSKFYKDSRKDWLKNDKYSNKKYHHVRDINTIAKVDMTNELNLNDN